MRARYGHSQTEWIGNLRVQGSKGSQFCEASDNAVRRSGGKYGNGCSASDELIQKTQQTSDISPETEDKLKLWPM